MPEARVLRQLVEALLFEGIATSELPLSSSSTETKWSFRIGSSRYSARGRVGAFGRVRVTTDSVRKIEPRGSRPTSFREILEDLPGQATVKAEIAEELDNTVRLCRWNEQHLPNLRRTRRELSYEQIEGLLHEGHPYHPCFKARSGFSLADHVAYGPEAANAFSLRWIAVRRSALRERLPVSEAEQFGAGTWPKLRLACQRAAAPLDEFGVLPVHPWQWSKLQGSPALHDALARRELVDLNLAAGQYRATQSLRTLLPVDDALADHVKLPLALRISSSLRTMQPETVRAAPVISSWLKALVEGDPFFEEVAGAIVLAEHGSSAYAPSSTAGAELASNLAAIWREPVARHLRQGEAALPFNALFAVEADGRAFVDPWLQRLGVAAWVERLLRVTLMPLWRLLAHHGVALEAHAQNLLLVHRDGMPERLALRDFHDSLEYVPGFLRQPALVPDLAVIDRRFSGAAPGRYHAMSSVLELRGLFIDSVMVFNLSELSWLLEREYGFGEREFWRLARGVLAAYGRSRWSDPDRAARLRLSARFVPTESLFKARLSALPDGLFLHLVASALHEPDERDMHVGHQ